MIDQIYPSPDFLKVKTISPERRELLAKLGGLNVIKFATEKEEQWQAIYQHGLTNGLLGLTLTTSDQLRWAIITPDNQHVSSFRYSVFDRRGFFGHGTFTLPEKAIEAAFDMGYRHIDNIHRLDAVSAFW